VGQVGFDNCLPLYSAEYERVFYLSALAQSTFWASESADEKISKSSISIWYMEVLIGGIWRFHVSEITGS